MAREITLELTNYCEHNCKYCSTDSIKDWHQARFMEPDILIMALSEHSRWDIIHLSGGEPLCHPHFYDILKIAKQSADRVIVHTNAIEDIAYNPNVIDGIRVEAYLTVPDSTNQVRILKRINQGREAKRPEVSFSHNYDMECNGDCGHHVIRPDGSEAPAPCRKDN